MGTQARSYRLRPGVAEGLADPDELTRVDTLPIGHDLWRFYHLPRRVRTGEPCHVCSTPGLPGTRAHHA